MKQIKPPSHAISGVFVFLLLGLFAVFSTVMVLMGAKAYIGTANRAAEHNAQRVAQAYVRSMVRSGDARGGVKVEKITVPVYVPREDNEEDEDSFADGGEFEEDFEAEFDEESEEASETYDGETVEIDAIAMESNYGGERYITRIYAWGGMLREWNASEEVDFEAANGEVVCAADAMTAQVENGVLKVTLSEKPDQGENTEAAQSKADVGEDGTVKTEVYIALRTAR